MDFDFQYFIELFFGGLTRGSIYELIALSYTLVNGEVYYRENSIMVNPDLNATAKARV